MALRRDGLSFAAIASRVGLRRSREAFEIFHRALQSAPAADKPELVRQELKRLEALEARIRSRDATEPGKMQHRLEALERMRERTAHSSDS